MKTVGFLLPVINGEIYVGQRGTDPFKGLYGPIGGKSEKASGPGKFPRFKPTPAGVWVLAPDCKIAEYEGLEYPTDAAAREFMEEAFQDTDTGCISGMAKIGGINDEYQGELINLNFYIANCGRSDFNPSHRELTDIARLQDVDPGQLYPNAKVVLWGLQEYLRNANMEEPDDFGFALLGRNLFKDYLDLDGQIPEFSEDEVLNALGDRETSIIPVLQASCRGYF